MDAKMHRLLITGCGRSGTKYIANVVSKLGLEIGHEDLAAGGAASWLMAFDDIDTPYGVGRRGLGFSTILHQVRHPLRVIPSLSTFTEGSWQYIGRHIPLKADEPVVVRAAKYWVYWNEQAQRLSQWTYRVEQLPEVFDEFCRRIGLPIDRQALRTTSTLTNSRKVRPWMKLLRRGLDKYRLGQSTRLLDFIYDRSTDYLGTPFTWAVLEEQAPGWSGRVSDLARAYGYTTADDRVAAECELQPA